MYIEMMTKEGSTKIVNFMTPRTGVLVLGCGHKSHYSEYALNCTLSICSTLIVVVLKYYDSSSLAFSHCRYLWKNETIQTHGKKSSPQQLCQYRWVLILKKSFYNLWASISWTSFGEITCECEWSVRNTTTQGAHYTRRTDYWIVHVVFFSFLFWL